MNKPYILIRGFIIFWFCLSFNFFVASAQSLDSLDRAYQVLVKQSAKEADQIAILEKIVEQELHKNPKRALSRIDTLLAYYKKTGNTAQYNKTRYHSKGFLYAQTGNRMEALKHYQAYAEVFQRKGAEDAYFLIDVGNLYYALRLFNTALKYYQEAEPLFLQEQHWKGLGTIYGNYSLVYRFMGKLDSSFHYAYKALALQEEKVKDTFQIAHSRVTIARLYIENAKQPEKSLPHLEKALNYFRDEKLKNNYYYSQFSALIPQSYLFYGSALSELGRFEEADHYLDTAVWSLDNIEVSQRAKIRINADVAQVYIKRQEYAKALSLLLKAEELSAAINEVDLSVVYNRLSIIYEKQGQWQKALNYKTLHAQIMDSARTKDDQFLVMNDQILQLERRNTIQKQEKLLEAEEKIRLGLYFILALVALVMAVLMSFLFLLRRKNKLISRYTQDLEREHQIKQRILLVMGHDLRSLFSVLMGNTQHIQSNLQSQRISLALQQAEQAEQAAKKAYMMMDGLMQWGSLQGQALEPQLETITSAELIQQTLEQVQPLSTLSGISILQDLQPQTLHTDPRLFAIILRNLLINALKHSPKDKPVLLRNRIENGAWFLRVEDQGPGIPPDILQRLFQPKNGVQIAQKGSGLGLEIVKQLCDTLQIQISAQNKPDRGAVFELRFNVPELQARPQIPSNTHLLTYTPEERQTLRPLAQTLQTLEVYEASAIHRNLQSFGFEQHPSPIQDWLRRLKDSLNLNDEQRYQALLQEILD